MSPIEEDLRRLFADPRRQVPSWPDPIARVRAGMRRRLRRRMAAAAGSVTLVLLVAIALAVTWARPPAQPAPVEPAPTPVPWLDLPASPYPRATLSPRTPTVSCLARDLQLSPVVPDGAGGTQIYIVEVRNTGPSPCTLSGMPGLRYTDRGATRTGQATELALREQDPNAVPATMNPSETARLEIDTTVNCPDYTGQAKQYPEVRLVLTDGGELRLGVSLDATCGVRMSQWSRPVPDATLANPGWDVLTVGLDLPATVQIGQTLEYVVTLTNPSGVAVALTPCPNYLQSITGVKAGGQRQLNCAVSVVPPHAGVRFAMQAPIPGYTAEAGPVKLTWQLETDRAETAPTATGTVTLTR